MSLSLSRMISTTSSLVMELVTSTSMVFGSSSPTPSIMVSNL